MVFISINMSLDTFLNMDINTRLSELDWLLFDRNIKNRSLSSKMSNNGNLTTYIDKILIYPLYYDKPLYLYLMKNKAFNNINFLSNKDRNIGYIYNMKKIPSKLGDNEYPIIPRNKRLWNVDTYQDSYDFLMNAFKNLVEQKDKDIAYYCLEK